MDIESPCKRFIFTFMNGRVIPALAIVLICLCHTSGIFASNNNYPAGASMAGMGNAAVAYPGFWSAWHNQGGLGYYRELSAGVFHENPFLVPGLGLSCIGLTLPAGESTLAFTWSNFGYVLYRESKGGLALGRVFYDKLGVGLQINYLDNAVRSASLTINSPGSGLSNGSLVVPAADNPYGRNRTVAIEAGIIARPGDKLLVGFHVFNPTMSAFKKNSGERIPAIMRVGLGYSFSDKLFLGIETEKDLDIHGAVFRAGIEYKIHYLYIRGGLNVQEYIQHSFGLGCRWKKFRADLAFSLHQVLGYTPSFSLQYVFR